MSKKVWIPLAWSKETYGNHHWSEGYCYGTRSKGPHHPRMVNYCQYRCPYTKSWTAGHKDSSGSLKVCMKYQFYQKRFIPIWHVTVHCCCHHPWVPPCPHMMVMVQFLHAYSPWNQMSVWKVSNAGCLAVHGWIILRRRYFPLGGHPMWHSQ